MTDGTVFSRINRLFMRHITQSTHDGWDGPREIRTIDLADGDHLRCAMDEEQAYWYEVVFNDDGRPMRVARDTDLTLGDMEILDSLLRENQA